MEGRYAIYFTLAAHESLYQHASRWLGHDIYADHEAGLLCDDDVLRSLNDNRAFTRKASQYGFHATLKPPFRLRQGTSAAQLEHAFTEFVDSHASFECSALELIKLGSFLALAPNKDCQQMHRLASACVQTFEPFRAALSAQQRQLRNPGELTVKQRQLLDTWGYPYVMDEFRFHMTLTDALPESRLQRIMPLLQGYLKPCLGEPLQVRQISLLHQATASSYFKAVNTVKLRSGP